MACEELPDLSDDERRVLRRMLDEWKIRLHAATIPEAATALGINLPPGSRIRVAECLRRDAEWMILCQRRGTQWPAVLLTDLEKLTARLLLDGLERGEEVSAAEVARTLAVSPEEARAAIDALVALGIFTRQGGWPAF